MASHKLNKRITKVRHRAKRAAELVPFYMLMDKRAMFIHAQTHRNTPDWSAHMLAVRVADYMKAPTHSYGYKLNKEYRGKQKHPYHDQVMEILNGHRRVEGSS